MATSHRLIITDTLVRPYWRRIHQKPSATSPIRKLARISLIGVNGKPFSEKKGDIQIFITSLILQSINPLYDVGVAAFLVQKED